MRISHIGHSELLNAIQRMAIELDLDCQIEKFSTPIEYREGDYDLLILDSQHFKPIILPNLHILYSHVLVLGHYTEESIQQAFCINQQISYIAYSNIETELPRYLNRILSRSHPVV